MISTNWLEQRRTYWLQLEGLLDRASKSGVKALNREELQELGLLYRQIASDLAVLREQRGSSHITEYVNRLLGRAHHTIYSVERKRPLATIASFGREYPSVFRHNLAPCFVALIIFVGGIGLGVLFTALDPDFTLRIAGPQIVESIERRQMWTHSIVAVKPLTSSALMTNNMSVALSAFAMGMTAGLGTAYMMLFNGLLLGVIGMACAAAGMSVPLWSFVAPHGSLELPAIVIAGGAGMRLAQGILFPGLLPRRDSIARAGTQATRLVLGCVPLLVVAGVIEAFVSPTELGVGLKFAVGASLFIMLVTYLALPGSPRDAR